MADINFDQPSVGNVSSSADALSVTNTGAGSGVAATSDNGFGVIANGGIAGVVGNSTAGNGVRGESISGIGVLGSSESNSGLHGQSGDVGVSGNGGRFGVRASGNTVGVAGESKSGIGVRGDTPEGFAAVHGNGGKNGVWGFTTSDNDSGVFGQNDGRGNGVAGFSKSGIGVRGDTPEGFAAVHGNGGKNGVWGFTTSDNDSGVFGQNDGGGNGVAGFSATGIGVLGRGGRLAGRFEGDVEVTGVLTAMTDIVLTNADCAEDFNISDAEKIEPGTVMVIDDDGALRQSRHAYDRRVAGVISGAGGYRSGITLDKQRSQRDRLPLALLGKVYCRADATYSPIAVGDLLTTSPTPGYSMKADDPLKAFGAVIGKALGPLTHGLGLIPILVALQ